MNNPLRSPRNLLFAVLLLAVGILAFGFNRLNWRAEAAVPSGQINLSPPAELWQATGNRRGAGLTVAVRSFRLNQDTLQSLLKRAPLEFHAPLKASPTVLTLPLPNGEMARFRIEESPILEPDLAARLPEVKTYRGQGVDDPTATVRFDWTPQGFHALVLSAHGDFLIEPAAAGDRLNYLSHETQTPGAEMLLKCGVTDADVADAVARGVYANGNQPLAPAFTNGATLRTYRLAVAASGEYAANYGGGNVANTQAAITSVINLVNAIYEKEMAVRFTLVNNTNIIFTNAATDPYSSTATGNSADSATLTANQNTLDNNALLGTANYDIGHLFGGIILANPQFSASFSGLASLGVVCVGGSKGRGVSTMGGLTATLGIFIEGVAHEIAHQFAAPHTFNGTLNFCSGGNRSSNSAYESGSGSTIMSYAGNCAADNIANSTNVRFHAKSFETMLTFMTNTATCNTSTPTNNTPPTVNGGADFTIPKQTPFTLTATGSDADVTDIPNLTFVWEQIDSGGTTFFQNGTAATYNDAADPANTTRPIFRPFAPVAGLARTFPSLTYILNNANVPPDTVGGLQTAEQLPRIARTLNFRVTARDNRAAGGGVTDDSVVITVSSSGPFLVTTPNTNVSWTGNTTQTVNWSLNGTNALAANVKISLSTDGGNTFPTVLLASTPNDGSESITVPNLTTSTARIKVEAVGNIFFDISDTNFSIMMGAGNTAPTFTPAGVVSRQQGSAAGAAVTVGTVADAQTAAGSLTVTQIAGGTATGITVTNIVNTNGTITAQVSAGCTAMGGTVRFQVSDGSLTGTGDLTVTVTANSGPSFGYSTPQNVTAGGALNVTPNTGPTDNGSVNAIVLQSQGTYTGTISVNNTTGVVSLSNAGPVGSHTIVVRATDNCGAFTDGTFTLNVTAANTAPTFTPAGVVSRQQGSAAGAAVTVGTVADGQTAAGSLTVTQIAGGTATGITVTNIVNTNGTITAQVSAGCTAMGGTVRFQVSDGSLTGTGDLNVTVTPNSGPSFGYSTPQNVTAGGALNVTPNTGPTDNGSVNTIALLSQGTYTGTISVNNTTGIVTLSNAGPVGSHTITVRATDNCGAFTDGTFTLNVTAANTAPTFTPAGVVSRQQGSAAGAAVTVGTVADAQTAAGSLTVTQIAGGTATGITVTNIVNTNGTITAQVSAGCTAMGGTVRFQVSDGSLTGTGDLNVTVTANSGPSFGYSTPQNVTAGGALNVSPNAGPTDNGSVNAIVLQSQGTYTGTISVNNTTGIVSISNAGPVGSHTIVVRATDNCGTFTDGTFTLNVTAGNTAPTFTPAGVVSRQQGSAAGAAVTVGTVADGQTAAGSLTVTQIGGGTATGITVTNLVNTNGTIIAQVSASCTATGGTVRFQVSDGALTGTGDLTVTVTNNAAPTLTYANSTVALNAATTVNPATGPTDNGTVNTIVVQSQGTYTGTLSVNNTTGVISVSNAMPAGTHTITIRATDNCGTFTDAIFTLTVTTDPCATFQPIVYGQTVNGVLQAGDCTTVFNDGSFSDLYTFNGTAGDQIAIALNSAAFDAYLELRTVAGTVLTSNNDGGGGTNARIPATTGFFTLPTTGVYRIVANTFVAGGSGAYTLTLTKSSPCITSVTVNSVTDAADAVPGNGVCETAAGNGICTLRAAIQEANALSTCSPFTINFSVNGIFNLGTALPNLDHPNLTINGPGANLATVRRNAASLFRVFTNNTTRTATLIGLTISNGDVGAGSEGGGVRNEGTMTITNCAINGGNHANGGGGVFNQGTLTMTGSTISGNFANFDGGGFYNSGNATAELVNCTISGNTGGQGFASGVINAANAGQTALLTMTNCTLTANTGAGTPQALRNTNNGGANAVTTQLKNTLLAGNTGVNYFSQGATTLVSLGNNLDSDGTTGFTNGAGGNLVGTIGNPINALLDVLANNGGATFTHALLPGSPAINAGTAAGAPLTDQRGITRVGNVDIGAYESRGFTLALTSGNNQSALVNTAFAAPLVVTVSSANGEPVQGGRVTFTVPGSGASATLGGNPVTLGANGQASVTATANGIAGAYQATAASNGVTGTASFSLTNTNCAAITVNPANPTLPTGRAGVPYSQSFTQAGGAGAITFSISAGALPTGLSLAANGALAGTPTVSGTFNFTVRATDANSCFGERAYSLLLNPACTTITLSPATLPNGFQGTTYSQTLMATGGGAPYTFAVTGGSLPGGLNLASGGALSGTPTAGGTFNFSVTATDNTGCTGTRSYTVIVSGNGLQFYPLAAPVRLLDTRAGQVACSQPNAPIQGQTSLTQPGRNICGIPANAQALTGNVTTVQSGGGFLTLYPSNAVQPTVASTNYAPNETINNVFTVGLGTDGAFKIFAFNTTEVVVDVTGYYAPPATGGLYFHPLPKPIRLLETRAGQLGCTTPGQPIQGGDGGTLTQQARISCDGVTIPSAALAIVGNATTVNPQGGGFLTLFPGNATRPLVAASNYGTGQIVNGPFSVGLAPNGEFKLYTFATTHLVVDVLGYYSTEATDANGAGLLFSPLAKPVRLLETRANQPIGCNLPGAPLNGEQEYTQGARGACDGVTIPANALGLVGNATVVQPNGPGFLTLWPSSAATRPTVATANYGPGDVVNRHFIVGLGNADGAFKIYSFATSNLVIDLSGYFAP